MLTAEQNIFLQLCILNLVIFYQNILPDNFDGVLLAVKLACRQKDFAKSSTTKKCNKGEVLILDLTVLTEADQDGLSTQRTFII
jgi:hypothetical protein